MKYRYVFDGGNRSKQVNIETVEGNHVYFTTEPDGNLYRTGPGEIERAELNDGQIRAGFCTYVLPGYILRVLKEKGA